MSSTAVLDTVAICTALRGRRMTAAEIARETGIAPRQVWRRLMNGLTATLDNHRYYARGIDGKYGITAAGLKVLDRDGVTA